jgi:hypothetical protein
MSLDERILSHYGTDCGLAKRSRSAPLRQAARQRKKERFTALLHHIDPALLRTAFYAIKRDAAPGIDGMTWEACEADLDRRIEELHARVRMGRPYRKQRRVAGRPNHQMIHGISE